MPRIIAGTNKKMRLVVPDGNFVRPTTDRIKESLFNVIADDIPGAVFLDLFAGTGQIGLEALSRGADFCTFIEKNHKVWLVLKENIIKSRFENCEFKKEDAHRYIMKSSKSFDIIYIDPPYSYKEDDYISIVMKIIDNGLLKRSGKILIEHDFNVNTRMLCDILDEYRIMRYGLTNIMILKRT